MRSVVSETDLVDLHTHSVANDGRWRADTLPQAALAAGIRVAALTDHDTTAGVAEFAREATALGIHPVSGVEVSCWWHGAIHHVLLYGVDIRDPQLTALLSGLWTEITRVAAEARNELRRRGYTLPHLEELRPGGGPLPVDVMVAAMRAGIASDFVEVVRILVEDMGISFAAGADIVEAVAAGHAAGGVAVLAHPGRAEFGFTRAEPSDVIEMVEAADLDGIEVYHWSHGPAEVETYGRLAAERGLLVSCGSDSHGPRSLRRLRGWEARLCRDLLERCGIEVASAGRHKRTGSEGT